MGQKTHPIGFRVGITENWRSRWMGTDKEVAQYIMEDHYIRKFVRKKFKSAYVSRIDLERNGTEVKVILRCARPGIIIGKRGTEVERLKGELIDLVNALRGGRGADVKVAIYELEKAELDAQYVADTVAEQISRRASVRRVIKKSIEMIMAQGARGCRILVSGRLNGAEIARREKAQQGAIPCQKLRSQISYGSAEAPTSFGNIGVKVWIYTGDHEKCGLKNIVKEKSHALNA